MARSIITRKKRGDPILEISKFIPNVDHRDAAESLRIFTQVVLETTNALKVKVVEVCPQRTEVITLLCPIIQKALEDLPLIKHDITVLTNKHVELPGISVKNKSLSTEANCLILIVSRLLETTKVFK